MYMFTKEIGEINLFLLLSEKLIIRYCTQWYQCCLELLLGTLKYSQIIANLGITCNCLQCKQDTIPIELMFLLACFHSCYEWSTL